MYLLSMSIKDYTQKTPKDVVEISCHFTELAVRDLFNKDISDTHLLTAALTMCLVSQPFYDEPQVVLPLIHTLEHLYRLVEKMHDVFFFKEFDATTEL